MKTMFILLYTKLLKFSTTWNFLNLKMSAFWTNVVVCHVCGIIVVGGKMVDSGIQPSHTLHTCKQIVLWKSLNACVQVVYSYGYIWVIVLEQFCGRLQFHSCVCVNTTYYDSHFIVCIACSMGGSHNTNLQTFLLCCKHSIFFYWLKVLELLRRLLHPMHWLHVWRLLVIWNACFDIAILWIDILIHASNWEPLDQIQAKSMVKINCEIHKHGECSELEVDQKCT